MPGTFQDNAAQSRYELDEGRGVSFAAYRDAGGLRALTHFETPPSARGLGSAGRLMEAILDEARRTGRKLLARCPYAVAWLERYPEAGDVLVR